MVEVSLLTAAWSIEALPVSGVYRVVLGRLSSSKCCGAGRIPSGEAKLAAKWVADQQH